jgi:hypothetical protein
MPVISHQACPTAEIRRRHAFVFERSSGQDASKLPPALENADNINQKKGMFLPELPIRISWFFSV